MRILHFLFIACFSLFVIASCDNPNNTPDDPNAPEQEKPDKPTEPTDSIPDDNNAPQLPEMVFADTIKATFCNFNFWGDIGIDTDNVILELGDVTLAYDAEWDYSYIDSEGTLYNMSLFVEHFADYNDAKIVTGMYTFDRDTTFGPMTIATESCFTNYTYYYDEEYDYEGYAPDGTNYMKDATVIIWPNDTNGYDVKMAITKEDGENILVTYSGEITFDNKYAKSIPPEIDENKEFECGYGEFSYDDYNKNYKIDIMAGDPFENSEYPSYGDRDRINIILTGLEEDLTGIPAGTYTVGENPGVIPGEYITTADYNYYDGSFYFYMDTATYEQTMGYFASGTVVVERNDKEYTVTVDVVTDKGFTIKATYSGTPALYGALAGNTQE